MDLSEKWEKHLHHNHWVSYGGYDDYDYENLNELSRHSTWHTHTNQSTKPNKNQNKHLYDEENDYEQNKPKAKKGQSIIRKKKDYQIALLDS